jgi:hypothetical protein
MDPVTHRIVTALAACGAHAYHFFIQKTDAIQECDKDFGEAFKNPLCCLLAPCSLLSLDLAES